MVTRMRILLAVLMGTLSISVTPHSVMSAEPVDGSSTPTTTPAAVANAVKFRDEFGLRSDTNWVAQSFVDPSFNMSFGVPLSPAETADLEGRMSVQLGLGPMTDYLATQPKLFGGLYVDQHQGGRVVVALTRLDAAVEAAATELAPSGAEVQYTLVTQSAESLAQVQAAASANLLRWQADGATTVSAWVDPQANAVLVGAVTLNSVTINSVARVFGDKVKIVRVGEAKATSCSRTNCGNPMKGGLEIVPAGGGACTSSFNARSAGSSRYVVTAGHCIQKTGGVGVAWFHNGTQFGTAAFHAYYNNSSADAGAITYSGTSPWNEVYASTPTDIRSMTSKASNSAQPVGGGVCVSDGANDYWHCGTITAADFSYTLESRLFVHQWQTSFPVSPGASGAPLLYLHTLFGVMSSTNGINSNYGTIDGLWNQLAVRPCLDASCS